MDQPTQLDTTAKRKKKSKRKTEFTLPPHIAPANFTIDQFCARHYVSRSFVYEQISDGKLKTVKLGRSRRITAEEDQRFRESLPAA